jgi:hypothetical protein
MLKHDIQLAIVLDTHCRPGRNQRCWLVDPDQNRPSLGEMRRVFVPKLRPKFSSVVFAHHH